MNIASANSMNPQLFDEWQEKLFRFVFENKRKFTELEWRWMRYQFEIEHMQTEQEESPLALAADGDVSLGVRDYDTWIFTGKDGAHTYEIKITRMDTSDGTWETYIDCVDETGELVPGVRLFIRDEFQLNEEGWLNISWEQYVDNINNSPYGLQCAIKDGNKFDLTLKTED